MRNKLIKLMIFLCIGVYAMAYSPKQINEDIRELRQYNLPLTQSVSIGGKTYDIDMERLLRMTAMVESNYGRDNYDGRIAKTFMQIEEDSFKSYMNYKVSADVSNRLELKDENAVMIAYVFYVSKLFYHSHWLDKFSHMLNDCNQDVEFFVYKVFFNSIKGATTYKKWCVREKQYIKMQKLS